MEVGETIEQAAKRELMEESGVNARELSLRGQLIFHVPSYPSTMVNPPSPLTAVDSFGVPIRCLQFLKPYGASTEMLSAGTTAVPCGFELAFLLGCTSLTLPPPASRSGRFSSYHTRHRRSSFR